MKIEKWNLTKIVNEVSENLLTSNLVPQNLSTLLLYINQQVCDFQFKSKEWENQLIPNWKQFLNTILCTPLDEKKIRLIPVVMYIIANNANITSANPAWIDLLESAMLALWDCYINKLDDNNKRHHKLKNIIIEIWLSLYIKELEQYFILNQSTIINKHGLHSNKLPFYLNTINDSYVTFWHIARLGILNIAPQEFINTSGIDDKTLTQGIIQRSYEWIVELLKSNPAAYRPLIDLHHIELFLIWFIFWQANDQASLVNWLSELEERLLIRRNINAVIPFIEGGNRLDLVAEYVTSSIKPFEYLDTSSYLLLMIMELCFSIENCEQRNNLLKRYCIRVVLGEDNMGKKLSDSSIDLFSWVPPENWQERIVKQSVTDGTAIALSSFYNPNKDTSDLSLAENILSTIKIIKAKHPWEWDKRLPMAVCILACIKNNSPLPPNFWRDLIFPCNTTVYSDKER